MTDETELDKTDFWDNASPEEKLLESSRASTALSEVETLEKVIIGEQSTITTCLEEMLNNQVRYPGRARK